MYIPPYLTTGLTQPSFVINDNKTDWAYGEEVSITVTLHQGTPSGMRISLIGGEFLLLDHPSDQTLIFLIQAVSSTHGNSMGSRTIFPEFSCSGTSCTITAPPNAHVSPPGWFMLFVLDGPTPSYSQWVRIGGDPAELGASFLTF